MEYDDRFVDLGTFLLTRNQLRVRYAVNEVKDKDMKTNQNVNVNNHMKHTLREPAPIKKLSGLTSR